MACHTGLTYKKGQFYQNMHAPIYNSNINNGISGIVLTRHMTTVDVYLFSCFQCI